MAELGIAASVLSIVSFALGLSKKLYQFAATTSVAGEEVGYVAKNITNYADALELLAERLEEGEEPIYSKHTVKVVSGLYDQSCDLFDKISELIPEPKYGRDELNFAQKVAWNFKKGRVEFLAGQIEYLKTTASLVATVLFAGKRIRSKRSKRRRKRQKPSDHIGMDQIRQRVTIAVVEQQQASNRLPDLQEKAVFADRLALEDAKPDAPQASAEEEGNSSNAVTLNGVNNALQLHSITGVDNADRNQIILQENDDLFLYLVDRFTTLDTREEAQPESRLNPDKIGVVTASSAIRPKDAAGRGISKTTKPTLKTELDTRKRLGTRSSDGKKVYLHRHDKLRSGTGLGAQIRNSASDEAGKPGSVVPPTPFSQQDTSHLLKKSTRQNVTTGTPSTQLDGVGKLHSVEQIDRSEREPYLEREKDGLRSAKNPALLMSSDEDEEFKDQIQELKEEFPQRVRTLTPLSSSSNSQIAEPARNNSQKRLRSSHPRSAKYTFVNSYGDEDQEKDVDAHTPVSRYQQVNESSKSAHPTNLSFPRMKIRTIREEFDTKWRPKCHHFLSTRQPDPELRAKEYRRLSESVMKYIIEAADNVDLKGDMDARQDRKALVRDAERILDRLDRAEIDRISFRTKAAAFKARDRTPDKESDGERPESSDSERFAYDTVESESDNDTAAP